MRGIAGSLKEGGEEGEAGSAFHGGRGGRRGSLAERRAGEDAQNSEVLLPWQEHSESSSLGLTPGVELCGICVEQVLDEELDQHVNLVELPVAHFSVG
jgi:hypothetical protein